MFIFLFVPHTLAFHRIFVSGAQFQLHLAIVLTDQILGSGNKKRIRSVMTEAYTQIMAKINVPLTI